MGGGGFDSEMLTVKLYHKCWHSPAAGVKDACRH
jgi:hypothetical protein